MNQKIKKILGSYVVYHLKELKYSWFPNKDQKQKVLKDKEDDQKRKSFYGQFVNPGELVFDVGANEGNRIRPLLEIGAKVVAIEPQESCYKYLRYKFGKKIEIVPKGLGENEETKNFYISNLSVLSSFSDEWINKVKEKRFKEQKWDKVVKVPITTLDKLIAKYGDPTFIKIDVEGYEAEVLKGLSKPVKMVSFEYTVPEQTDKVIECIERLTKINPAMECNYSIEESMKFQMTRWLPAVEMKEHVQSESFIKTGFGDVYVRTV